MEDIVAHNTHILFSYELSLFVTAFISPYLNFPAQSLRTESLKMFTSIDLFDHFIIIQKLNAKIYYSDEKMKLSCYKNLNNVTIFKLNKVTKYLSI